MIDGIKSPGWPIYSVSGFGFGALTMAIAMRANVISGGDVLAFAGAMLGVTVTILGTIYVEGWKEDRKRSADRKLLLDAIEQVRSSLIYVATPFEASKGPPALQLRLRYLSLKDAHDALNYAISRTSIDDMREWRMLQSVVEGLSGRLEASKPVVSEIMTHAPVEQIEQWHKDMVDAARLLNYFLAQLPRSPNLR